MGKRIMIAPTYNMTTRVTLALACLAMTAFAGKRQPSDIAARLNACTGESPSVTEGSNVGRRLMGKHPDPKSPYRNGKWGIYHDYSVQKYLLEQIEEAETNAAKNNYPVNGPCLARHGNDHQCVRKRYLVSNSKRLPNGKEELVYVVKTFQGTGNDQTWWDSETDEEMYFQKDGDKRERHNVDTIGEFKIGAGRDSIWYTVYWRCQKRNHDECSHDSPKEYIEKQTPTPSPDVQMKIVASGSK